MAQSHPARLAVTPLEDRITPTTPPPAVPPNVVVSGSGPDSLPMVQVYNGDGSLRAQFLAFDAAFKGGVNVAMADVNADGVTDVIAAAGAGGGPHVKVFDGWDVRLLLHPETATLVAVPPPKELYSFFAYGAAFRGGVNVAGGDVDADGYADVVTGAGEGGGPHVKVFSGKTGAEVRSFFAFDATFRGGVNVAVGELQENPYMGPVYRENADILVGSGAGMKATVKGFNGRTGEEFFAINPYGDFHGGVYVASGDTNGGGFDDVITGAGAGGGPHVTVYDGYTLGHLATILLTEGGPQPIHSFFAYGSAFRGGVRVGAGDLNNDTRVDIVTAAGPGGGPHIKAFSGYDATEIFSRFKYGVAPDSPEFTAGSSIAAPYLPNRPVPVVDPPISPIPPVLVGPPVQSILLPATSLATDFTNGADGWTAGVMAPDAFFPSRQFDPQNYDFDAGVTPLPATVGTGTGYRLAASDGPQYLLTFLKKQFGAADGILPDTTYTVDFEVQFASDVAAGAEAYLLAPPESVLVKVGGGAEEPLSGYRPYTEPEEQYTSIGNIANGLAWEPNASQYASTTRRGSRTVRSDAAGNLWLVVAADTGLLGRSDLYFQSINVTITPSSESGLEGCDLAPDLVDPLPVIPPPLPPILVPLPLPTVPTVVTLTTDFNNGAGPWSYEYIEFTDYSPGDLLEFERTVSDSGLRTLPAEVGSGVGFLLSRYNMSGDLFMYMKRNVAAEQLLVPNQTYRADFTVTFASDAPAGLLGGGSAPAEGVFLKVGGGATEPMPAYEVNGDVRLNVDKGNQSTDGSYATVIGDIANGRDANDPRQYATITRTGSHTATSDSTGNLWLLVGTDSGFIGRTTLYYQSISVTLTPVL